MTTALCLVLAGGLILAGCDGGGEPGYGEQEQTGQTETEQQVKMTVEEAQTQLEELRKRAEELGEQIADMSGEAQEEMQQQLDEIESQIAELEDQLTPEDRPLQEIWDNMKALVADGIDSIEERLDDLENRIS